MEKLTKCILHIGAHKTGTTFLQAVLKHNSEKLRENGIVFLSPKKVRNGFIGCIYRGAVKEGGEWLKKRTRDCHTLLISEEKLPGNYYSISAGFPYQQSGEFIGNLISMLPEETDVQLLLSVREYSDFIESCYLQYLKHHPSKPYSFERYLGMFDNASSGWCAVIEQLLAVARVSKIHVWPYEAFRRENNNVISIFESIIETPIAVPNFERTRNPSFSDVALNLLLAAHGLKKSHHKKFRKWLMHNLTTSDGYNKPELMNDSMRSIWVTKYHDDLRKIMGFEGERLKCYMFDRVLS